jgi:hypothetical protein
VKYYPALVNPRDRGRIWKPPYKTETYSQVVKGKTEVSYTVEDAKSLECPVSCITQKSADLVYLITGLEKLKEYAGSSAGLTDLTGATSDAIRLICNEASGIESARMEAQERYSHV